MNKRRAILLALLSLIGINSAVGKIKAQALPPLIPNPKFVQATQGAFALKAGLRVLASDRHAQSTLDMLAALSARHLNPGLITRTSHIPPAALLLTTLSSPWAKNALPATQNAGTPHGCDHTEGYTLHITPEGIQVIGHDAPGLFYGVQTLLQCLEALPNSTQVLPCLHIEDWPDMPIRAMHLCLFRFADRQPDIPYIKAWLGRVAPRAKLNTVIIQVDDLLQYRTHPEMSRPTALSQPEMRALIAYGKQRHLTLIPQLQCLSHQDSLFGYAHPDTLLTPKSGTYNPLDPRILPILTDLFGELHTLFQTRLIHLGFDEVDEQALSGHPQTHKIEPSDLYLTHLTELSNRVHRLGMRPMIWPDMLLRWDKRNPTAPSLLTRIPKDVILCDWQYRAQIDEEALTTCLQSGHEVWATGSAKYQPTNLPSLAYVAHKKGIRALIGSTWNSFGPLSNLAEAKCVSSLLTVGEYAWTVPLSIDAHLRLDAVETTRLLLQDAAPHETPTP